MSGEPSTDLVARETAHEQAFVDVVYRQLETSTRNAQALAREGHGRARLGHEGGLVERDAMVFQAARRIATLDAAHEGLVFGRLDLKDPTEAPRYIGRIGLRDENRDTLLIDWRAPAAAVFYQATADRAPGRRTPSGAALRRAARVVGVEDDLLDAEAGEDLPGRRRGRADGPAVPGPRPVDALDRGDHPGRAGQGDPRPGQGRRRDQRRPRHRQDRGRAAPRGVPALHRPRPLRARRRARRRPLRRLHALHRAGAAVPGRDRGRAARRSARSSTGSAPTATTPRPWPTVKGAARMAELLRRTARQAVPGAPQEFRFFYRDDTLVLAGRELGPDPPRAARRRASATSRPGRVPAALVDALWRQVRGERGAGARPRGLRRRRCSPTTASSSSCATGGRRSTRTEVLGWLRDPGFARAASARVSSSPGTSTSWLPDGLGHDDLSIEDVPLVDELRYLIGDAARGGRRGRRPAGPPRRRQHAGAAPRSPTASSRGSRRTAHTAHRGRHLRPRPRRRGAGPHPDAVADGRPPRASRHLDRRRRPRAVVVAAPGGGPRRPARWRCSGSRCEAGSAGRCARRDRGTASTCHQLPQQRGDLPLRRGVRRAGRASPPTCPTPCARTGVEPEERSRRRGPRGAACASAVRELLGAVDGTVGVVAPVARRDGGARAGSPRAGGRWTPLTGGDDARGWSCSPGSTPRAWSSTASWWSQPDEIEARVADRTRHALRRAHPGHPAAGHPVASDRRLRQAEYPHGCTRHGHPLHATNGRLTTSADLVAPRACPSGPS